MNLNKNHYLKDATSSEGLPSQSNENIQDVEDTPKSVRSSHSPTYEDPENNENSDDLKELANSLLLELKSLQKQSLPSLNTAIFLLRTAYDTETLYGIEQIYLLIRLPLFRFSHTWSSFDRTEAMEISNASLQKWQRLGRPSTQDDAPDEMELSMELYSEFLHSVEPPGIDQVVNLYRHILTLLPLNHADKHSTLLGLSESLVIRFITLSKVEDLDEAIQALRDILSGLPPPNPARYQYMSYLSSWLFLRFLRTTDFRYFKEAMEISQTEINEYEPAKIVVERGLALSRMFQRDKNILHLEGAIAEYSLYLSLTPKHHPNRHLALTHLSTSYMFRYQQCNEKSDYETALNYSREAVGLLPSSHPLRASILSLHVDILAEKTLADSHAVLSSVTTTSDQKSMQLLDSLYDIEELIGVLREVLELGEARDELYCRRLYLLGEALYLRSVSPHALSRDLSIDQSIDILKKGIDRLKELKPNSYDALMISLTTTLALIYQLRFTRFREISDSETSASLYREALLHELDIVRKVALTSNLALTLFERFSFNRVSRDLDEAIALISEILDISKSSQLVGKRGSLLQDAHHLHLKALGKYLHARFHHQGDPSDLDNSIEALRQSMAKHDNHSVQTLLYRALFSRYQLQKSKSDLDEVLAIFHDASLSDLIKTEYIHEQTPDYGETARTGSILLHLFELSRNPVFLKIAQDTCSQGARYSMDGVLVQLENSVVWAHASPYASDSALEAYTLAITLLPQVATVNLDVQSRQDLLRMTPGIACDAALCAIGAGKIELAVELLSAGRSIFWSQSLNLRNSVQDLQMVAPDLAERLRTTSSALEKSSLHDLSTLPLLDPASERLRAMEFESVDRRHLHESWHLTLEEIRDKVPGFENFMRPRKFADLQKAAEHGPVVILTAGKAPYGSTYHQNLCDRSLDGCIALILTKEGVEHIVLPTFGHTMAEVMGDLLQSALHGTRTSRSMNSHAMMDQVFDTIGIQSRPKLKSPKTHVAGTNLELEDSEKIFRYVLRALWIEVVAPIVNKLGLEASDNPQHIWWCPTGPFAFLPIHAAGIYNGENPLCLMDYAVSSYIPSLENLLAPLPIPVSPESFNMVAIIQPESQESEASLPSTRIELENIKNTVTSNSLTILGDPSSSTSPSTIHDVLNQLPTASFVHFACHGTQNMTSPLESSLILEDGNLKLSMVMKTSTPHASLAFLSACETAKGDEHIPDEALHMAATMVFAGFRGVIGTMWSILDEDGPIIAKEFYRYLFRKGPGVQPQSYEAAYALHLAVKKLRSKPAVGFQRWAPFMHMGV